MTRFTAYAISAALMAAVAPPALSLQSAVNNGNLAALIARHAATNNVPESLIRRVIHRESRGNSRAVSKGNFGLMQIRLGTAGALRYRGDARGLLDADTNMTYAVKYLAGAYKVAGGNESRAVSYYASGYYFAAKRRGMTGKDGSRLAGFASAVSPVVPSTVITP